MKAIYVTYWVGTTEHTDRATTYHEALRIGSRNQNAYGPYYSTPVGVRLVDTGFCFVTEAEAAADRPGRTIEAYA